MSEATRGDSFAPPPWMESTQPPPHILYTWPNATLQSAWQAGFSCMHLIFLNNKSHKCKMWNSRNMGPPKKIKRLVVFFCKKSDGKKYKLRYSRFSWPSIHCNNFFIQSLNPLFLFLCVFSRPHESGPVRVFRFRGHPQVQSGPVLRHRGRLHHLPPAHPPPRYPPH